MDNTLLVILLAAAIVLLVFFRTRKGAKPQAVNRRQWDEYKRQQQEDDAPRQPEYRLKDLNTGGLLHLSLPKGLEEDYSVIRRDRVDRYDEQIEYDLILRGSDPNVITSLNWWTIGVETHAWLVESIDTTPERLGLSDDALREMRTSRSGNLTYRDDEYTLEFAGTYVALEGGLRPGKEFYRWDFRNDKNTRSLVIELREWVSPNYIVYSGRELWLRDVTIIQPRADTPPEQPTSEPV